MTCQTVRRTDASGGRLFFFSSRRRHTRFDCDWSSDVCSSDLLLVVGEGRERGALERIASENVVFTGRADDATLRSLLASARGLVFPSEDDFGIVCVEALASGAPVVALAAGGIFDIVRDGEEGVLVDVPEPRAFAEGVLRAERARFEPKALRDSARRFNVSRFRERVRAIVDDAREKGRAR